MRTNKEILQSQQQEINSLKSLTEQQQIAITELNKKIYTLESKLLQMEGKQIIATKVSTLLRKEIDDLQQYGRRSCMVIAGIPPANNDQAEDTEEKVIITLASNFNIDENLLRNGIDKAHRLGPKDENNKQATIVKFKTHSMRSKIYRLRKTTRDKRIKLKVSLTKQRQGFLDVANKTVENSPSVEFAFADENGNIRVLLKEKFKNKKTMAIQELDDLTSLIAKLEGGETFVNLYPDPEADITDQNKSI